jgi:hypothetical protein
MSRSPISRSPILSRSPRVFAEESIPGFKRPAWGASDEADLDRLDATPRQAVSKARGMDFIRSARMQAMRHRASPAPPHADLHPGPSTSNGDRSAEPWPSAHLSAAALSAISAAPPLVATDVESDAESRHSAFSV